MLNVVHPRLHRFLNDAKHLVQENQEDLELARYLVEVRATKFREQGGLDLSEAWVKREAAAYARNHGKSLQRVLGDVLQLPAPPVKKAPVKKSEPTEAPASPVTVAPRAAAPTPTMSADATPAEAAAPTSVGAPEPAKRAAIAEVTPTAQATTANAGHKRGKRSKLGAAKPTPVEAVAPVAREVPAARPAPATRVAPRAPTPQPDSVVTALQRLAAVETSPAVSAATAAMAAHVDDAAGGFTHEVILSDFRAAFARPAGVEHVFRSAGDRVWSLQLRGAQASVGRPGFWLSLVSGPSFDAGFSFSLLGAQRNAVLPSRSPGTWRPGEPAWGWSWEGFKVPVASLTGTDSPFVNTDGTLRARVQLTPSGARR